MVNIGLMGRSRSGKDTAGRLLTEHHGYSRVAFADPLREMALALNPVVGVDDSWRDEYDFPQAEFLYLSDLVRRHGWEYAKDEYPEVRRVLQRLGLEAVRATLGDDTWVRHAMSRVADNDAAARPTVVTDVRFRNERDALRSAGFRLVWVERPGLEPDTSGHASERELGPGDADVVLANTGTVDDLHEWLRRVLRTFPCSSARTPHEGRPAGSAGRVSTASGT